MLCFVLFSFRTTKKPPGKEYRVVKEGAAMGFTANHLL